MVIPLDKTTSKAKYRNNSGKARKWLETIYGPGSAEDIIRRLALKFWEQSQVADHKNERGRILSGSLLLEWGRLVGIKKITHPPLTQKAHIAPCEKGFRLSIRTSNRKGKVYEDAVRLGLELNPALRWDFAHELGHTFFYDTSLDPPQKIYGYDSLGEEALCQQFAAELLLPNDRLIKLVSSDRQVTVDMLINMVKAYGAPLRSVIRRLQDIMILRGTCVILLNHIVASWSERCLSKRPLPKTGIEIYVPPQPPFEITKEYLYSNEAVHQVCSSATYWNSMDCKQHGDSPFFVEGLKLKEVAPRKACLFLFHEEPPIFTEKLLFDNA